MEKQSVYYRFLKNYTATTGLVIILLATLVALFSYLIAPDNSTNADEQLLAINDKAPGFTTTILHIPKKNSPNNNFFKTLLFGKTAETSQTPILSFSLSDTRLEYQTLEGQSKSLPLNKFTATKIDQTSFTEQFIEEKSYLLGTDKYGRDTFSRLLVGTRISLSVGAIAVLISLTIGILLGAIGGYYGGKVDDFIMFLVNTIWSIPTLLLIFAIILALGRGFYQIFIAVGLTMWVEVARVVRGQVFELKHKAFIEAAKSFGFTDRKIIFKHILPNIIGPIMVIASANFATAILVEAGLSYLGFGVQPPTPSWGNMLEENYGKLFFGKNPIIALAPGIAIMILVLSFNLVGNGLRDAFDRKTEN